MRRKTPFSHLAPKPMLQPPKIAQRAYRMKKTTPTKMTKLLKALWRVITFPFVLIFNIITFPFRALRRINEFLNTEPEDRPLIDTFSSLATEAETRQSLWDHIEALRAHLLRIVIALAIGVGISFYFTV